MISFGENNFDFSYKMMAIEGIMLIHMKCNQLQPSPKVYRASIAMFIVNSADYFGNFSAPHILFVVNTAIT